MTARPALLTKDLSVGEFEGYYWLKEELTQFCREHALPASGGKQELADRISCFLRTGSVSRIAIAPRATRTQAFVPAETLSLDTRVPENFRCGQEARAFFVDQVGAGFRFTVPLQAFIHAHPGISFGEIITEWRRLEALRKSGRLQVTIAPQFEYNQFTHDYFQDPRNQGKSRQDCVRAWKAARVQAGGTRYQP
jgi:hypothetical protein